MINENQYQHTYKLEEISRKNYVVELFSSIVHVSFGRLEYWLNSGRGQQTILRSSYKECWLWWGWMLKFKRKKAFITNKGKILKQSSRPTVVLFDIFLVHFFKAKKKLKITDYWIYSHTNFHLVNQFFYKNIYCN